MAAPDTLCAFTKGEERGVELLKQLLLFAPAHARSDISKQIVDERRHAFLFDTRLKDLNIDCEGMKKNLCSLYDLAQTYVDEKHWVKCIAIQAVIEELAMASFGHAYPKLDLATQEVLRGIIADEKRHLDFCFREIKKFGVKDHTNVSLVHERVLLIMKDAGNYMSYSAQEKKEAIEIMRGAYALHKARLNIIGVTLPAM